MTNHKEHGMRHRIARMVLSAAAALTAAYPAAADEPRPEVFALTGLALECEGGTVVFTSGQLVGTVHEHQSRRGGDQLVFALRLRDAWLTDGAGEVFRAVGSASNSSVYTQANDGSPVELGTFVANFTLLGREGRKGAVHVLVRATADGIRGTDRGDCRIAW